MTPAERKPFGGKIYVGDSMGIQIKGSGAPIACEQKEFDDYVCMKRNDFEELVNGLLTPKK